MRHDLKKVRVEVRYADIEKIILDINDSAIIQFHFNESKPENIPQIMNIFTKSRRQLCDHLKIAFNTDFMYRMNSVGQIPLFKG